MIEGLPTLPDSIDVEEQLRTTQPSLTYGYDFERQKFTNKVDELEAVVQAINKILITPRFAYVIYDGNYGNDFASLIGQPYEFIVTVLPRLVNEALVQDDRVISTFDFVFRKISIDAMSASFKVNTIYGTIEHEMEVRV